MTPQQIEAKPGSGQIGIVHLGLGAFHRAHQAVYLERYRQRSGDVDWGVCSANLRSSIELERWSGGSRVPLSCRGVRR